MKQGGTIDMSDHRPGESKLIPLVRLRIADVVLDVEADQVFRIPEVWQHFRTSAAPDVTIAVRESSCPRGAAGRHVGILQGIGAVYENAPWHGGIDFHLTGPQADGTFVEFDLAAGQVAYRLGRSLTHDQYSDFILAYAVKAFLLANLKEGLLLHACGVARGDHSLAFAGRSGAGKTTLGNLFQSSGCGQILNDDTVAITWRDATFRLWGTPWTRHGADSVRNAGCLLDSIFFIDHGRANTATPLSAARALRMMLAECACNWNGPSALSRLERLCRMDGAVGLYELRFVPDSSAVDYVCGLADAPIRRFRGAGA